MLILGTIIISILCISDYLVDKNASKSLLSFTVAILTLFTISADTTKTIIFIIAYFFVTTFILFISSIRLHLSNEKILSRAAFELYGNDGKLKEHIKELSAVEKTSKSVLLKSIDKCKIILFFSERKMPSENNITYIPAIDDFKIGTNLDLQQSCEVIYFFFKVIEVPNNSHLNISQFMRLVLESSKDLPISTRTYYELILDLQDSFFIENLNAIEILEEINGLIIKGHTKSYVIKKMAVID